MTIDSSEALKPFLRRHGLLANKSLGQHFLASTPTVDAILDSIGNVAGVLEIGPGPGILTCRLAAEGREVIALELDRRMIPLLGESAPSAKVVEGDALTANLGELLSQLPEPRAIVSNMPYYITGPLTERVSAVRDQISVAVLMMQREVAHRFAAKPGHRDRGAVSVLLQSQFEFEKVVDVAPTAFLPPPKVWSTVLRLVPRLDPFGPDEERLVRLAFAQPRKTLANNLTTGLKVPRESIEDLLEALGLSPTIRSQFLDEAQWRTLARKLA